MYKGVYLSLHGQRIAENVMTDQTIKVLGGRNLPSYWERFDRLQRTAYQLGGTAGHPRGVFRFSSHDEFEAWKQKQRLARPNKPTL